jgi:hypothetical protein
MRILSYVKVALFTTVNILLNGATLGRYVWLKGRVERGVFTNWARRFRYVPKRFAKPATEQEIVELLQSRKRLHAPALRASEVADIWR